MKYIDLHVHSTSSDGTFTPTELVDYALEKGLTAFSLTDHDTTDGLDEAFAASRGKDLEIIPGIEFSTEYHGKDIHILGLDIACDSDEFQTKVKYFQNSRDLRNRKMIARLGEEGFAITWEDMEESFPDSVWTRAHFARILVDRGYVSDITEVFNRYLGDNCSCFIPREKVTPAQAVRLIRRTGGIPILAHPMLYRLTEPELRVLIRELKTAGMLGIEAIYSTHSDNEERYIRRLARMHGLCISGGSDFHGKNKPTIDLGSGKGNLKISYDILKQLRAAK